MKNNDTYIRKTVYAVIFIVVFLLVWQIVAWIVNDDYLVPSVLLVVQDMLKIFYVKDFADAYFSTLIRSGFGFFASFIIGFALAVLSKKFDVVKGLCSPLVSAVRLVPTMAIASLLVLALSPTVASVIVCFTVVMPYVYSSALAMLESVSNELLEMAKVYNIPYRRVISRIYLPTLRFPLIALVGTAFSFALKITVSSEVVAGVLKSLGGLINTAQNVYISPSLVAAVAVWTVLTGLVVELVMTAISTLLERGRAK